MTGTLLRHARVLVCAPIVLGTLALTQPAFATPPAQPALTTWGASGAVNAEVVIGNVLYLGGAFSSMISPDGLTIVPRAHLAAIDLTTGDLLDWAPTTNGGVDAIVTDGTNLIIGGGFTTIDGVARKRLGAIDQTGALVPWATGASDRVLSLFLSGSTIYVGGKFTVLGGQPRIRLGAVTTAGDLLDWTASPNDRVTAITTTAEGDVIIGGYFSAVGDEATSHIARLDATTGAPLFWEDASSATVTSLVTGPDDDVYAGMAGSGGRLRGWTADGSLLWTVTMDGDVNAVTYYGGQVIAGGHWITLSGGTVTLPRLAAFDPSTGTLDTAWKPKPNKQVWSLATDGTTLVVGGVFTTISHGTYRRVAVFR